MNTRASQDKRHARFNILQSASGTTHSGGKGDKAEEGEPLLSADSDSEEEVTHYCFPAAVDAASGGRAVTGGKWAPYNPCCGQEAKRGGCCWSCVRCRCGECSRSSRGADAAHSHPSHPQLQLIFITLVLLGLLFWLFVDTRLAGVELKRRLDLTIARLQNESDAYKKELAGVLSRHWSLNLTGQSLAELRRAVRDARQELRWMRQDFVFLRSASELALQNLSDRLAAAEERLQLLSLGYAQLLIGNDTLYWDMGGAEDSLDFDNDASLLGLTLPPPQRSPTNQLSQPPKSSTRSAASALQASAQP